MKLANSLGDRLNTFGIKNRIDGDFIFIEINEVEKRVRIDQDWEDAFSAFKKARSVNFDLNDLSFTLNRSIEFPLVRLDPDIYGENFGVFGDAKENTVEIHRASNAYSIAHFESSAYEEYFKDIVIYRLERLDPKIARPIRVFFKAPYTATYRAKGKRNITNLKGIAAERVQACLVKLAIDSHVCFEFSKPKNKKSVRYLGENFETDYFFPTSMYEKNISNYYKVARSSPFPSQSFLAYYHVLEYYFLKVSEDNLHYQLKAVINKTNFKANIDGIDKLISLVRGQANHDNETEMLRKVLERFVPESEFIDYLNQLEEAYGDKIYTKRRLIFGEQMNISPTENHALSNAANLLKHVRNAIVHSSDRYKREECHIPLSETEDVIEELIPLVRFFAEKVIYGTAVPYSS